MKHKLPRSLLTTELTRLIDREMRRQKLTFAKISKKEMQQLSQICKWIETTGLPDHLICKKLPRHLGSGIFLCKNTRPITQGEVIACYAGIASIIQQNAADDGSYAFTPLTNMLLNKKEQAVFDKGSLYRSNRLYAFKIDAKKQGNFTRYINHSEKPNIVADLVRIPKNSLGLEPALIEILYTAKKTIHPGEQLLVSYEAGGKSYWKSLQITPFPMTPKTFLLNARGCLGIDTLRSYHDESP